MISVPVLAAAGGIRHGFFTRQGGVSEGIYAALNCGYGSGDEAARVKENRSRAMVRLGLPPEALTTVYQVHSAEAVRVAGRGSEVRRADGLATATPRVALGILTADCAPVLLADPGARVIGAAHAGWRGALDGILESTVAAMIALGARREAIAAAIGPCIGARSYEVGPGFRDPFVAANRDDERFFVAAPRTGHELFDLAGYVARRLADLGLRDIAAVGADTYADADRFFSYRRATHRGEGDYGRLLSAICLIE